PGRPAALSEPQAEFIAEIADDYRPDELAPIGIADLGRAAAHFWVFAAVFEGPAPAIRIRPALGPDGEPLGADVVEIVQPDAPFLVDSVMGELVESGADVLAMFHPIVEGAGGRRSAIQVWV